VNYFLDTKAVIAVLRNRPQRVRERLRRVLAQDATVSISSLVLFELWYHVARSSRPRENAEQVRAFSPATWGSWLLTTRMPGLPGLSAAPWRRLEK